MPKWLELVLSAALTGLILYVGGLASKVDKIEATQLSSKEYIYRIKQNEVKIEELKQKVDK